MKKGFALLVIVGLLYSCSSTQYFCRTWKDETTGKQMLSDTILYIKPFGLINWWDKEKGVKYKMKVGNLACGVAFASTYIIPVVMGGFFLFEADTIIDNKYEYVKVNPNEL